jgi:hypothetical protein
VNGDEAVWNQGDPDLSLSELPGTVELLPLGGTKTVTWANGELPAEVKMAGGAEWTWQSTGEARKIVCLASAGARLFIDGELIHEYPSGLPYVPAPQRCPDGSRFRVNARMANPRFLTSSPTGDAAIDVPSGSHRMRLELANDPGQVASVILTYPTE